MNTLLIRFQAFLPVALLCCAAAALSSCCSPPKENFMQEPLVQQKVLGMQRDLIAMLPAEQQAKQSAHDEAKWLTLTAFEQSAIQARKNKPVFFGWINNNFVNTGILDRGLCWEYQHDLFRELRRRPLHYFHLGATVRDQGRGSEHNCVYVCAKGKRLEDSLVLDPWVNCGHLKVIPPRKRKSNWQESPDILFMLERCFPEGHTHSTEAHITYEDIDDKGNKAPRFRTTAQAPDA